MRQKQEITLIVSILYALLDYFTKERLFAYRMPKIKLNQYNTLRKIRNLLTIFNLNYIINRILWIEFNENSQKI